VKKEYVEEYTKINTIQYNIIQGENFKYNRIHCIHMKEKIVTVRVDENSFKKLIEISKKEKISKSAVLRKALEFYFSNTHTKDYNQLLIKIRELERKYNNVINRLNVILRQMEGLMKVTKNVSRQK